MALMGVGVGGGLHTLIHSGVWSYEACNSINSYNLPCDMNILWRMWWIFYGDMESQGMTNQRKSNQKKPSIDP